MQKIYRSCDENHTQYKCRGRKNHTKTAKTKRSVSATETLLDQYRGVSGFDLS